MAGTETLTVARWLYSTLADDTALTAAAPGGIHEHPAPMHATSPFVTFQMLVAADTQRVGTGRVLTRSEWLVRVTARDAPVSSLGIAVDRVDALLTAICQELTGGIVHSCARISPFQMVETPNGERWAHLGGIYRVISSSS
jgi:hypothetical protein